MWVMWLFFDLLAAEGLVMLITSLVPIFVVALAATAFANGLWMCVGGFLVPMGQLNPFWKFMFHFIDYQVSITIFILRFPFTNYPGIRVSGDDGESVPRYGLHLW